MELRVKIDGVDITDSISIHECEVELSAGQMADNATLTLNDVERRWRRWAPKVGQSCDIIAGDRPMARTTIDAVSYADASAALSLTASPVERLNATSGRIRGQCLGDALRSICDKMGVKCDLYGDFLDPCGEVLFSHEGGTAVLRRLCDLHDLMMSVAPEAITFVHAVEAEKMQAVRMFEERADSVSEALGRRFKGLLLTNGATSAVAHDEGQIEAVEVFSGEADADTLGTMARAMIHRRNRAAHSLVFRTGFGGSSRPVIAPGGCIEIDDGDGNNWRCLVQRARFRWSVMSAEYFGEVL